MNARRRPRVCVAGLGVTGPSAVRALLALRCARRGGRRPRRRPGARAGRRAAGRRRRGPARRRRHAARRRRPRRHLTRLAAGRSRCSPPRPRAASRSGARSSWPGGCGPAGPGWLGVTGTNGKTTTVQMLASILRAAGHRAVAAGNVGLPLLDAVLADPPYDVLAVELSSFQLHWTSTVEFVAGAVLNVAPDHLDWHGSLEAYAADKALVWRGDWYAVVQRRRPARVAALAAAHRGPPVVHACAPARGPASAWSATQLVDRGIGTDPASRSTRRRRRRRARPTCRHPGARPAQRRQRAGRRGAGPRAHSATGGRLAVHPADVRAGLRAFDPGAHRIAHVATVDGVDVRRRLQGDQRARRGRVAAGVPARRVGRRRAGQGRDVRRAGRRRRPTGCAASC